MMISVHDVETNLLLTIYLYSFFNKVHSVLALNVGLEIPQNRRIFGMYQRDIDSVFQSRQQFFEISFFYFNRFFIPLGFPSLFFLVLKI